MIGIISSRYRKTGAAKSVQATKKSKSPGRRSLEMKLNLYQAMKCDTKTCNLDNETSRVAYLLFRCRQDKDKTRDGRWYCTHRQNRARDIAMLNVRDDARFCRRPRARGVESHTTCRPLHQTRHNHDDDPLKIDEKPSERRRQHQPWLIG